MGHRLGRLARRLAIILAAILVATSTTQVRAHADPASLCAPVNIGDFAMWDATGGGTANVPVYTLVPCALTRVLTYRTFDITAVAGVDYEPVYQGLAYLAAGTTGTTIPIKILAHHGLRLTTTPQSAKQFGVQLVSGARFEKSIGIVTLLSGEAEVRVLSQGQPGRLGGGVRLEE